MEAPIAESWLVPESRLMGIADGRTFRLNTWSMANSRLLSHCLTGALLALASEVCTRSETLKDWQNPQLTGVNNLAPHATMVICPDAKTALKIGPVSNAERVKSPFYRSLNGEWKYHYAKNHSGRVPDFWKPGFRRPGMGDDPGAGERRDARATASRSTSTSSIRGASPGQPPFVPEDDPNNTVNSYRRTFTVPEEWAGRRVLLTFDGVNSFFYLWVNGQKVGMGKDSRTPVEFDITPFLAPGREPARRRELPLVRRLVSGRPGLLAHERHLPRRVSLVAAGGAHPRLRGEDGPGRAVSRCRR